MDINSTFAPLIQSVSKSPYLPAASREELADLLAQLQDELRQVPAAQAAQVQAVAKAARTLAETANQAEPLAAQLHTAVSDLEASVEPLADVAPEARQIAFNIVAMTQGGSA